jgi:hypothetical protein
MNGRHTVRKVTYPGSAPECGICGDPVVQIPGQPLRHVGEQLPVISPEREDARPFLRAVDVAEAAIAALPPDASAADVARAVIEGIYVGGLLRRRPAPPRPRQEPDPAEAAAAVRARYEAAEPTLLRVG